MKPFLTVYTPTFRRPFFLELCKASVAQQWRTEHVIVEDHVGLGIDGMYGDIRNHVDKVHGEYVLVLSDDNVLVDPVFAAELETYVRVQQWPDVVVFKGRIDTTTQPAAWCCEPIETMIDLSCFAVRREVWVAYAESWGRRYEGDFDFIHRLWADGCVFAWWDRLVFQALKISRGAAQ